jgi:ABC-type branched-subunit amino acid transport system substrate-binding protein
MGPFLQWPQWLLAAALALAGTGVGTLARAQIIVGQTSDFSGPTASGVKENTEGAKLLDEHRIALVAPSTGAMSLHKPVNPWIFNVRASDQREAEKSISLLASMGLMRIALAHVDDSAGHDVATGAIKGFEGLGWQPVFVGRFDRLKPDFAPIARAVARL